MKKPALFDGSTEIYIPLPRPLRRLKDFHDRHKSMRMKDIHLKTKYHLFVLEHKLQRHPIGKFIVPQSKLKQRILTLALGLVVVGTGYLAYSFSTANAAWYNTGWMYRKKITINHTKVPSTQTDFPVLISLQDSSLATNALQNGDDIMFTSADGTTKLSHEIESYQATRSGTLVAWVKVPSLSSTTDTVLYMYYGNRSASNQQSATTVWDSNSKMVHHLEETGSCTGSVTDSTTNANNGTCANTPVGATGMISGGMDFESTSSQRINISSVVNDAASGPITLSGWFKLEGNFTSANTVDQEILSIADSVGSCNDADLWLDQTDGTLRFHIYDGSCNEQDAISSQTSWTAGVWYYVVGTFSTTNGLNVYVNGTAVGSNSTTVRDTSPAATEAFIGAYTGPADHFDGIIDEVRISNTARSADWITTEYNNQGSPSTFFTIGQQQLQKNPTLFWKFDEGYGGVKAGDNTEKNNYGVLGNAIWQNSAMCLFEGTCLKFEDNSTSIYFSDGFEIGDTSNWSGTSAGNYSVSTENPLNGSYSIKLTPNGTAGAITKNVGSSYTSAYGHAYVYIASNPTPTQFDILHVVNTSNSGFIIYRNSTGYMCVWNAITSTGTCSSYQQIPLDSWHKYELYVSVSATTGKIQAYFDGNLVTDLNLVNQNTGTLSLNQIEVGEWNTSRTATFYVDDVRMDNGMATYIKRDYKNDSELDPGTSGFSVGAWFRHPTSASGTDTILSRVDAVNGVGYKIYYSTTNGLCFGIDGAAGSFPSDAACVNANYADNQWHYVEGVKTGTSNIKIYVDGKEGATDGAITASSLSGSTPPFIVGADYDTVSNAWEGYLDEVRYYDYARSTSEIKADYNAKGSVLGASASFGVQNPEAAVTNGLVGYWKMDDGVNAPCSLGVNKACDSSGNGNTGTWTNGVASTSGKFGNSTFYDGTNDYVSIVNSSSIGVQNDITISAWIKRSNLTQKGVIMEKTNGTNTDYEFGIDDTGQNDKLYFYADAPSSFVQYSNSTISDTNWHLVTFTRKGIITTIYIDGVASGTATANGSFNNNTYPLLIGGNNTAGTYFSGRLDDARLYNRALSPSDVAKLYDWAPGPVAQWKFDERTGTTVYNSMGNGNNGTWNGTGSHWISGKYSSAGNFNGTNDNVAISSISNIPALTSPQTISFWYKSPSNPSTEKVIFSVDDAVSKGTQIEFTGSAIGVTTENGPAGPIITATHPSVNTWHHMSWTWDGTTNSLYIDGVLTGTSATSPSTGRPTRITIGDYLPNVGLPFGGQLDDIRYYDYARTAKQVISDMNAGHPAVGSPIASALLHLKLDDGFGNVASNSGALGSTGNGKMMNFANPASATSGWTNNGRTGKGLLFDGSDDYINENAIKDQIAYNDLTYSLWFRPTTTFNSSSPTTQYLIALSDLAGTSSNNDYKLGLEAGTGKLLVEAWDNSTNEHFTRTTQNSWTANTWYHVVVTHTAGKGTAIYINGKLANVSDNFTRGSSILATQMDIGRDVYGRYFSGTMDEVKIYNYALSESDVKVEYNQGKGVVFGAISTNPDGRTASFSAQRGYCPPGSNDTNCSGASGVNPAPVAEWKMDERTGTTINDTSGNGFNGALFNSPLWTSGKVGSGVKFDGIDDYISVAHNASLNFPNRSPFTISFWMKSSAFNGNYEGILMKDAASRAGWEIFKEFNQNYIVMERRDSAGTWLSDCYVGFTPQVWTYITYKYDGTTLSCYQNGKLETSSTDTGNMGNPTDPLIMGSEMDAEWEGILDDVRIYNYARSNAQIMWDYNRGKPVGWWKFDECAGRTIYDSSGNQSNGTISGTTDPGNCSTGSTYWYNGRNGKFNASFYGDGSDNYVNITPSAALNFTEQISVTAWVYADTLDSNYRRIVSRDNYPTQQWLIEMEGTQPGKIIYNAGSETYTSNMILQTGRWYHVAMIYDGSTSKLFINGKLDQSGTSTGAINTAGNIGIGADPNGGTPWNGKIDDVRIYNFALTPAMLRTIYNNDAAVLFAPLTGTP